MSKQSKRAAKKKKTDKKVKKKKQMKKLGLTKFIPPTKKPQKKRPDPTAQGSEENGTTDAANADGDKPKPKLINLKRKHQKDMSLIERCKMQMSSSLLRLVDEKLYTSDTAHINLNKDEFVNYHEAYDQVSESWPTKPIDFIVKFIKKRLFPKRPAHKFKFADVGCGKEPLLKMKLPKAAQVHSFDLVSTHNDITQANMDRLPLNDESVHCAAYSLSLMARNLGSILMEAKRVIKLKGSLVIVEVTSRFQGRERRFVAKVERLGFKKQSMTPLKPNQFFTFFHFSKEDCQTSYPPAYMNIELKPCVYKAR